MVTADAATGGWSIPVGSEVIDVNGDRVGEVTDAVGDCLIVERSVLFQHERAIPLSAVRGYQDGRLYLRVPLDDLNRPDDQSLPPLFDPTSSLGSVPA